MSTAPKDFSVAIVGGGMCGLACAYGLSKAGIDVIVFESATEFAEIGAGVGLGPNALRALQGLGLYDAILKKVDQTSPNQRLFEMVTGSGNHESVFDYVNSTGEGGNLGLGVYRPVFLDAVLPLLNPDIAQFNKRCVSVEKAKSGRQLLRFADGTTHEADLVIGADGIKSTIRATVLGETHMGFSGSYAYRGLVSIDELEAAGMKTDIRARPFCWVGEDKHIISFPIKNDTVLNVVAFTSDPSGAEGISLAPERPQPWVEVVTQQELLEKFQDWGNDVTLILKRMTHPSRWSIHTMYPPLKSFVYGRTVLIGDAAHAMVPHLGAGVGQGFEDVYTLCRLLGHPDTKKSNLDAVLGLYNELRPPRANMVLKRSLRMGRIYENYGPGRYDIEEMQQRLAGMWEPVWRHDLESQVSLALRDISKVEHRL